MGAEELDLGVAALAADREFFAKCGPLPLQWSDVRRFPRFYLRGQARALLHPPRGDSEAEARWIDVLTCDVSRGGVGLRCGELLFPEQRLRLETAGGVSYPLKVVWCRRLGPGRYAAGCVFRECESERPATPLTM